MCYYKICHVYKMQMKKGGLTRKKINTKDNTKTTTPATPTTPIQITPIQMKHIIRCCYKSKTVSEPIIQSLETDNFLSFQSELSKLKELPFFAAIKVAYPELRQLLSDDNIKYTVQYLSTID